MTHLIKPDWEPGSFEGADVEARWSEAEDAYERLITLIDHVTVAIAPQTPTSVTMTLCTAAYDLANELAKLRPMPALQYAHDTAINIAIAIGNEPPLA